MDVTAGYCIYFIASVLLGALIAGTAYMLPVRMRASPQSRRATAAIYLPLSLLLTVSLWGGINAYLRYVTMVEIIPVEDVGGLHLRSEEKPLVLKEVWIREVIPAPVRASCYTTDDLRVCRAADAIGASGWPVVTYAPAFLSSAIAVLGVLYSPHMRQTPRGP